MKRFQKLLCFALAVSLLSTFIPGYVKAEQVPSVNLIETSVQPGAHGEIPAAIDLATVPVMTADDLEYTSDLNEAAVMLRQAMIARQSAVQICFQIAAGSDIDQAVVDILYAAFDHTGEPNGGDYLYDQYGGCSMGGTYYTQNNIAYCTITYVLEYYTDAEQEAKMDAAVKALLDELNVYCKSDYDKFSAVYEWVCANIVYDFDNLRDDDYMLKYTGYAALCNRTAVCQGYAVLLYRLMLELGVDCRIISGSGNGGRHAWNIVALDGAYYNVDATWDASSYQALGKYRYCLQADQDFVDHYRDSKYTTKEFNASYPMADSDYDPSQHTQQDHHSWDDGEVTVAPTETQPGVMTYTCQNCNAYYTQELPALDRLPGDFDADNKVTDADAIYLLRFTLFPEIYPVAGFPDMNNDGSVTDADAIYLLRHTLFPQIYPLP